MRTPLNKALKPDTKRGTLPSLDLHPKKADDRIKNKEIQKVADAAAELAKDRPNIRAQFINGIVDAQEEQAKAAQAKEDAVTEEAFNKACDDESHAREKEAFFRKQLEHIDSTPRMDEAEYNDHVNAVKSVVEKAAADFRKTAEKAINDIVIAKTDYLIVLAEADEALTALDAAANVLQAKYRYKTITFTGDTPPQQVEDRNEWTRHAIRYNETGKGYDLIARDGTDWNKKTCAAWKAAESAKGIITT